MDSVSVSTRMVEGKRNWRGEEEEEEDWMRAIERSYTLLAAVLPSPVYARQQ